MVTNFWIQLLLQKLLKDSEYKNLKFDDVSDKEHGAKQPLSKLNTLLGKTVEKSPRPSLFHRQGVAQRPTYDTISKPLTGGVEYDNPFLRRNDYDNEVNLISQRLNDMRKRRLDGIGEDGSELSNNIVGQNQFGSPLWMQVLHEQRSTATEKLRSIDFTQDPQFQGDVKQFKWPRKLQWSENHSFRQWFTSKENEKATRLIEGVIDSPSEMINPLTIVGGEQSGTTFLLRATGQAMLRRQEGHVLWFNALDLEHVSHTPIQDALYGCSTLIVDDVEQFAQHDIWKINMGEWFEYALQSSIQIITSSKQQIQELPSSKMRRFLLDGIETFIPPPSTSTLIQFGRWYARQRNMIIEEEELVDLVHSSQKSWRSIRNMLEEYVHSQKQPIKNTKEFSRNSIRMSHRFQIKSSQTLLTSSTQILMLVALSYIQNYKVLMKMITNHPSLMILYPKKFLWIKYKMIQHLLSKNHPNTSESHECQR